MPCYQTCSWPWQACHSCYQTLTTDVMTLHAKCETKTMVQPHLGADSIKRCPLTSIGNPVVEIRRSYNRLISTMGFPLLVRRHHYIESGPWLSPNPLLVSKCQINPQLTTHLPSYQTWPSSTQIFHAILPNMVFTPTLKLWWPFIPW